MNYMTHSLGGVATGMITIAASGALSEAANAAVMSGAVLGSLFPDIDHGRSYISQKAKITSFVASNVFKHRGFTHTPVFLILTAAALSAGSEILVPGEWQGLSGHFISGFLPGMLSHLILDTFNVQGIPWLWPVRNTKYHVLGITTGSWAESAFALVLMALLVYSFFIS